MHENVRTYNKYTMYKRDHKLLQNLFAKIETFYSLQSRGGDRKQMLRPGLS